MWRNFLRYYGLIIFWSAVLLVGTLGELATYTPTAAMPSLSRRMLGPMCALAVIAGYLLGRALGKFAIVIMGSIIGGILVITPANLFCVHAGGYAPPVLTPDVAPMTAVFTEDPFLFVKGAAGCAALFLLTAGLLRFVREVTQRVSYRALPRSVFIRVLMVVAPIMLELLRIVVHLDLPVRMPWEAWVAGFLSEPGWPYALAITTWLSISYLWVDYDCRILPYLLHRTGIRWDGDDVPLNEAYVVDQMLHELRGRGATSSNRSKPADSLSGARARRVS
jgi:hypothetical protein